MTREEAIKFAEHAVNMTDIPEVKEFYRMSAAALCPVSREQVEKVWRGKWIDAHPGTSSCKCTKCGAVQEYESTFCCHCGAPMTEEAVEMVMEKINNMEEITNEH